MKKKYTLIIFVLLIISCKSYIDTGINIQSTHLNFNYLDNYNEFIYKSKLNTSSDKQVHYTTNFKIDLPKKIINWLILSNEFYFEYKNKQMIYIYSDYESKNVANDWVLKDTNDKEVWDSFIHYWLKIKYNEDNLKIKRNRVSKIYTNGKVKILLLNIKEHEFDNYLKLIKSFKYIEKGECIY